MNPLFFFLLKILQASCSKDCQSHFMWQYKFEFYFDPSPMSSCGGGKPISLCRTHLLIRTHFAIHKKIWENKNMKETCRGRHTNFGSHKKGTYYFICSFICGKICSFSTHIIRVIREVMPCWAWVCNPHLMLHPLLAGVRKVMKFY
jgi:hypothetical protein